MIIIAESGSTKTDWVIIKNHYPVSFMTTQGFNPNYFGEEVLKNSIIEVSKNLKTTEITEVFFYGSGCSSASSKKLVTAIILEEFINATVEVNHDLFGAARALFGHGKGIAAVLGTGSSSCLFDNGQILEVVPSLGYLFADEGSGFQIGKKLIKAAFNQDFPLHLQKQFEKEFSPEISSFLKQVYSSPKPNSLIANFATFAVNHRNEPFIKDLVRSTFEDFFTENIIKYSQYQRHTIGFVGSVAFLFKDELTEVADKFGSRIEKIIKNPIEALVKFHIENP